MLSVHGSSLDDSELLQQLVLQVLLIFDLKLDGSRDNIVGAQSQGY